MQGNHATPTQPAVALSFLCLLLDIIRQLWTTECLNKPIIIDAKYFYDGTFKYQNVDRIGGVLSHLRKVHRQEMIEHLGENHSEIITMSQTNTIIERNDDICNFVNQ